MDTITQQHQPCLPSSSASSSLPLQDLRSAAQLLLRVLWTEACEVLIAATRLVLLESTSSSTTPNTAQHAGTSSMLRSSSVVNPPPPPPVRRRTNEALFAAMHRVVDGASKYAVLGAIHLCRCPCVNHDVWCGEYNLDAPRCIIQEEMATLGAAGAPNTVPNQGGARKASRPGRTPRGGAAMVKGAGTMACSSASSKSSLALQRTISTFLITLAQQRYCIIESAKGEHVTEMQEPQDVGEELLSSALRTLPGCYCVEPLEMPLVATILPELCDPVDEEGHCNTVEEDHTIGMVCRHEWSRGVMPQLAVSMVVEQLAEIQDEKRRKRCVVRKWYHRWLLHNREPQLRKQQQQLHVSNNSVVGTTAIQPHLVSPANATAATVVGGGRPAAVATPSTHPLQPRERLESNVTQPVSHTTAAAPVTVVDAVLQPSSQSPLPPPSSSHLLFQVHPRLVNGDGNHGYNEHLDLIDDDEQRPLPPSSYYSSHIDINRAVSHTSNYINQPSSLLPNNNTILQGGNHLTERHDELLSTDAPPDEMSPHTVIPQPRPQSIPPLAPVFLRPRQPSVYDTTAMSAAFIAWKQVVHDPYVREDIQLKERNLRCQVVALQARRRHLVLQRSAQMKLQRIAFVLWRDVFVVHTKALRQWDRDVIVRQKLKLFCRWRDRYAARDTARKNSEADAKLSLLLQIKDVECGKHLLRRWRDALQIHTFQRSHVVAPCMARWRRSYIFSATCGGLQISATDMWARRQCKRVVTHWRRCAQDCLAQRVYAVKQLRQWRSLARLSEQQRLDNHAALLMCERNSKRCVLRRWSHQWGSVRPLELEAEHQTSQWIRQRVLRTWKRRAEQRESERERFTMLTVAKSRSTMHELWSRWRRRAALHRAASNLRHESRVIRLHSALTRWHFRLWLKTSLAAEAEARADEWHCHQLKRTVVSLWRVRRDETCAQRLAHNEMQTEAVAIRHYTDRVRRCVLYMWSGALRAQIGRPKKHRTLITSSNTITNSHAPPHQRDAHHRVYREEEGGLIRSFTSGTRHQQDGHHNNHRMLPSSSRSVEHGASNYCDNKIPASSRHLPSHQKQLYDEERATPPIDVVVAQHHHHLHRLATTTTTDPRRHETSTSMHVPSTLLSLARRQLQMASSTSLHLTPSVHTSILMQHPQHEQPQPQTHHHQRPLHHHHTSLNSSIPSCNTSNNYSISLQNNDHHRHHYHKSAQNYVSTHPSEGGTHDVPHDVAWTTRDDEQQRWYRHGGNEQEGEEGDGSLEFQKEEGDRSGADDSFVEVFELVDEEVEVVDEEVEVVDEEDEEE